MAVDTKRSGVKALLLAEFVFDAEPGDMLPMTNESAEIIGFNIACPGCGKWGCISFVAFDHFTNPWRVTGGSTADVRSLSVMNSILNHCCGWHGYLKNGVFESC